MPGNKQSSSNMHLIDQFKRAAVVCDFGYRDEDNAMQLAGLRSADRAVQALEASESAGRKELAALLSDPDPAIRVLAAGYLVKVMPDKALEVLEDIRERCLTEARMTASRMLRNYERGDFNL
jgi:hypothetical protein